MDLSTAAVAVTGATAGIGRATAIALAPRVGALIVHGPQPPEDVQPLVDDLDRRRRPGAQLAYLQADFGVLADVHRLAKAIAAVAGRLDVLVNNAGRAGPDRRQVTVDGNEVTLQTNYLASVALTDHLLPLLREAQRSRVVNVASATHLTATFELDDLNLASHAYSPVRAYAQSKLAIVTYTAWLARRLGDGPCSVLSLHPGVITTRLLYNLFAMRGEPAQHAAANVVLAVRRTDDVNGRYLDERRPASPNPAALDRAVQDRLMDETYRLIT